MFLHKALVQRKEQHEIRTWRVVAEGKPLTFSGQSYVRWRLNAPMQRRFSLSLEVRSVQKNARLVHAVGRVDYSLLEVRGREYTQ